MIRVLLRLSGFVLLAAAFAALVVDGSRSIAGGRLLQDSWGDTLAWLGGARYAAAMQAVGAWPGPVQRIVTGVLAVPGWIVTATLGLGLLHAGRPSGAGIGFSGRRT